jgi:hypothetical protein
VNTQPHLVSLTPCAMSPKHGIDSETSSSASTVPPSDPSLSESDEVCGTVGVDVGESSSHSDKKGASDAR